jgi:hypothetical protein
MPVSWGADESLGLCARAVADLRLRGGESKCAKWLLLIDLDWSAEIYQWKTSILSIRKVLS